MLSEIKKQEELAFWKTVSEENFERKAQDYADLFEFVLNESFYYKNVLEIGSGPKGMIEFVTTDYDDFSLRVAIEPLASEFAKLYGDGIHAEDVVYIESCLEDCPMLSPKFDTVFCLNALDHGDGGFHLLPKIKDYLNERGDLYLFVHLRTPEQLNSGHDHCLTEEDYRNNLQGWEIVEEKIMKRDPIEHVDYKTLVVRLRKVQ